MSEHHPADILEIKRLNDLAIDYKKRYHSLLKKYDDLSKSDERTLMKRVLDLEMKMKNLSSENWQLRKEKSLLKGDIRNLKGAYLGQYVDTLQNIEL